MNRDMPSGRELKSFLEQTFSTLDAVLSGQNARLQEKEVGTVSFVGQGIVRASGPSPCSFGGARRLSGKPAWPGFQR
jgi:hypothetical protein